MRRIVSVWLPFPATDRLRRSDGPPDRSLLERLADWCVCFTPWSAVDDWAGGEVMGGEVTGGGLWLDVTGCAHLKDGEDALLAELVGRLRRFGLSARAAAADTPGAAWAWARFGAAGVLPPGRQRTALGGLPVTALRLETATAAGLARLGLKTIGDLYALPRPSLTARFGASLALRLDQALGRQDEPISPRPPPVLHRVHLAFAEPIARPEDVSAAVRSLLERLAVSLEQQRLGVRRLDLAAFRLDATVQSLTIGTSRPNRDPVHLLRLLAEPLSRLDCGFGIETLRLTASEVGPLETRQSGLVFGLSDQPSHSEALGRLIDSLGNRLGFERIVRFELRESHLPERAVGLRHEDISSAGLRAGVPVKPADGQTVGAGTEAGATDMFERKDRRPLRLFSRPEPVEAMAPVPDSPPLLFRWRRHTHRIVRAEGPERLAAEWWRKRAPDRDYYCVEDEAGRRFWLYREGLYGEARAPRWFLHGVFP